MRYRWTVGRIAGVPVVLHWTVIALAVVVLAGAERDPATAIIALASYFAVALFHELGHAYVARRLGLEVFEIRLYPVLGLCEHETPATRYEDALVAWGGVAAQAPFAVIAILWVWLFGFTPVKALNALLAIVGFYSAGLAVFNLLPIAPLDGARAWKVFAGYRWPRTHARKKARKKDLRLLK